MNNETMIEHSFLVISKVLQIHMPMARFAILFQFKIDAIVPNLAQNLSSVKENTFDLITAIKISGKPIS